MNQQCKKCGNCCKSTNNAQKMVLILPEDVSGICSALCVERETFLKRYCIKNTLKVNRRVVIYFTLKFCNNKCIFLSDENLCTIYNDRPTQCKKAPYSFFSHEQIWNTMPCVDMKYLQKCDSTETDREYLSSILKGYDL